MLVKIIIYCKNKNGQLEALAVTLFDWFSKNKQTKAQRQSVCGACVCVRVHAPYALWSSSHQYYAVPGFYDNVCKRHFGAHSVLWNNMPQVHQVGPFCVPLTHGLDDDKPFLKVLEFLLLPSSSSHSHCVPSLFFHHQIICIFMYIYLLFVWRGGGVKKKILYLIPYLKPIVQYNTIQYNNTLLILKKEIQFAFNK